VIVEQIVRELEALREGFVFGGVSGLKSEGVPVNGIPPMLEAGGELDSALKALQLTTVVGFAWDYIDDVNDQRSFDKALTQRLDHGDTALIKQYRDRYLKCQGDVDLLCSCIAEDIHRIWGSPEPAHSFKNGASKAAAPLMILSQAATARACGDLRTEKRLKSLLYIA
jgi:hypothetical protein